MGKNKMGKSKKELTMSGSMTLKTCVRTSVLDFCVFKWHIFNYFSLEIGRLYSQAFMANGFNYSYKLFKENEKLYIGFQSEYAHTPGTFFLMDGNRVVAEIQPTEECDSLYIGEFPEYLLLNAYQNGSGSADQNGSGSADQNGSENADQNGSENADQNGSESADQNGPESSDQNGSENADQNGPESSDQNGPESSDQNGPESSDQNGPESSDQNGPENADQNGPENADQNGPESADQNGPESADQNGPESADQNGPESADQRNLPIHIAFRFLSNYSSSEHYNPVGQVGAQADFDELCHNIQSMFIDSAGPDFTLKFGDVSIRVHKSILYARSKFFEEFFNKDEDATEFSVSETTPTIMYEVLLYIYGGELCSYKIESIVNILKVAYLLNIPSLKEMCLDYFDEINAWEALEGEEFFEYRIDD